MDTPDNLTIRLISDALGRLEEKTDRIAVRMDTLVETTNHRLDNYSNALAAKADVAGLGVALARHITGSKLFQAGGFLFVVISIPVVLDHWRLLLERMGL